MIFTFENLELIIGNRPSGCSIYTLLGPMTDSFQDWHQHSRLEIALGPETAKSPNISTDFFEDNSTYLQSFDRTVAHSPNLLSNQRDTICLWYQCLDKSGIMRNKLCVNRGREFKCIPLFCPIPPIPCASIGKHSKFRWLSIGRWIFSCRWLLANQKVV